MSRCGHPASCSPGIIAWGLLIISGQWQLHVQDEPKLVSWRECSKKIVQSCPERSRRKGHSLFDAQSVHVIREHGKMATMSVRSQRTPLADFFNIPFEEFGLLKVRPAQA